MNLVSVVAGGWSFGVVDHKKIPGVIVAVNGAAEHLRCPIIDDVVTMDRLFFEYYWSLMLDFDTASAMEPDIWVRNHAAKRMDRDLLNRAQDEGWLHVFRNDNSGRATMSDDPDVLNGSNSGMCALNLAYQMKPKRLYLFGFDMCLSPRGEAYWYKHYFWARPSGAGASQLAKWANEFTRVAAQFRDAGIEVINVSPASKIKCWPRVSAQDLGFAR
jgi:hypothetical protein